MRMKPHMMRIVISAVPPWEMKGRGNPVSGMMPSIAPILMNAWMMMREEKPSTTSPPKRSCEFPAMTMPRAASAMKSISKRDAPTNPVSSAKTAKTESPSGSGR